jgi:hypothetical protein
MAPQRRAGRMRRQVGPDRRGWPAPGLRYASRGRSSAAGRAAAARAEGARRPPRRPGRRAAAGATAAALAPPRTRSRAVGPPGRTRPLCLARPCCPPTSSRRADGAGADRARAGRPLPQPHRHALHRIAITQARVHPPARAYLERKQREGKSRREALRCLKRQLARTVHATLKSEPLLTSEGLPIDARCMQVESSLISRVARSGKFFIPNFVPE